MEQYLPLISLLLLVAAILLGFWRKINMGVIAIAFSFVIGRMAGIADSKVLGSFGTSLFLRLLGVMLLLAIVQGSGTIEKITKKFVSVCGNAVKFLPILVYILFAAAAAVGAGGPPALALAALVTVPLAYQLKISPIMLALPACWGGFATPTALGIVGVIFQSLTEEAGIDVSLSSLLITALVMQAIPFIVWYVFSGWLKMKPAEGINYAESEPFNKNDWFAVGGLVLMVFLALAVGVDIGLAAFVCSFLLLLIPGVVDERKALASISWGTLVMIGGMGMLISVVQQVGGIDMLSNFLSSFMTQTTAPAILSIMGSLLSFVSSTTGVVMPTMIPAIPGIVESMGGGSAGALAIAVTMGAGQTAISPFSTGGALILAAYGNFYKPTEEERSKLFIQLLIAALAMGLSFAILGLLGFYGFFV